MRAFEPWLPLDGGNRTLVLAGAAAAVALEGGAEGAAASGGNLTVLDFGREVNLMFHPTGHAFYTYGLSLEGLAPAFAGLDMGIQFQMVNGYLWPTITGAPQHFMVGRGGRGKGQACRGSVARHGRGAGARVGTGKWGRHAGGRQGSWTGGRQGDWAGGWAVLVAGPQLAAGNPSR